MLQNESVDEDLEHFEDITDETESQATTTPKNPDNSNEIEHTSDGLNTNGNFLFAGSEDDESEEANDLLVESGSKHLQESQSTSSVNVGKQLQESNVGWSCPGGYDLRHREPSYWYYHLLVVHLNVSRAASIAGKYFVQSPCYHKNCPFQLLTCF